jgi:predicted house-cleaning noncanonical NTP pyrophosphatase (MazG superfamily)
MSKLVRDNIPDILLTKGEEVRTRVLNKEEFRKALLAKLDEEAIEALTVQATYLMINNLDGLIVELADLFEVIETICAEFGISMSDVRDYQLKKRLKEGSFSRRIAGDFG